MNFFSRLEIKLFQHFFSIGHNCVNNNLKVEVIELQNDELLKNYFREVFSLSEFCSCLSIFAFKEIRQFAQKMIAAFVCEQIFLIMKCSISKFLNILKP